MKTRYQRREEMKGLLILSMKSMMVSKADGVPQKGLFPTGIVTTFIQSPLAAQNQTTGYGS
jgi:hypothetical protein